ncbi:hypothetical protein EQG49_04485 [Periweissella cryptocerci]|uniref:Schlafen AlbA-2 domain-containing protein n=1 Tax=Periweissella cryptocerci TaxID=2506420 RepID=A0A4P6YSZ3_9LACO|nr:RNA-binding domain-containing protein [Periweissella cryptocerci]QBO35772.1 hypothetical protein EQG49_04485 [Periweissella cryptocerci]
MEWAREDVHTEYKTATGGLPASVWETYSAFLNTDGGTIYLGVAENKKGHFETVGVKNADQILADFVTNAHSQKVVSYTAMTTVDAQIINVEGHNVIKITVPRVGSLDKPVFIKGNLLEAYYRIGDADQRLTQAEINRMIADSTENQDNHILEFFTFEADVDMESFAILKGKILSLEPTNRMQNLSDADFAYEIGITDTLRSATDNNRYLTAGGLLMVGKWRSITSKFPNFFLDYSVTPTAASRGYRKRIVTGSGVDTVQNVFSFYVDVYNDIKARTDNPLAINPVTGMRRDDAEVKLSVVRELLANTLMHASYTGGQGRVMIKSYDDYFEFSNPGQLRVSEWRYKTGGKSDPRNQVMMNIFRRANIVESYGNGGRNVFQIAKEFDLKQPELVSDIDGTTVKFWKIGYVDELGEVLNEKQMPYVVMLNDGPQSMKAFEVIEPSYAKRRGVIEDLLEQGAIYKIGGSRNTQYVLKHERN